MQADDQYAPTLDIDGAPVDEHQRRLTVETLEMHGIRHVVIAAVDMHGRLFGRRMATRVFLAKLDGIECCGVALAQDVIGGYENIPVDAFGWHNGAPDFKLIPDPLSLVQLGWQEGVALCFATVVDHDNHPVPHSPRSVLARQVERLRALGLEPFIGTELEFHLYETAEGSASLPPFGSLRPTNPSLRPYLITSVNKYGAFFDRLTEDLEVTGIPCETVQSEAGAGQWEFNLEYGSPLTVADRHVLFKMAVKESAERAGMLATFMARPDATAVGSSGHMHVSLRDTDGNFVFYDPRSEDRLSDTYRWAVAGILQYMPEMMVFYAPFVNSYRRIAKDGFCAGHGTTWGYDNRSVTVRTVGHSAETTRLEFRVPGADVNPHLGFAALLASIAEGIENQMDPGKPSSGNAYHTDTAPLPKNLLEASAALRASEAGERWFGPQMIQHYADFADHEWREFMDTVTTWEYERYFLES